MAGRAAVAEPEADLIREPGPEPDTLTAGELLIEEVSIDGMCGVY